MPSYMPKLTDSSPYFANAQSVEEALYDALEKGEVDALMLIWCHDEDPICVHPSGHRLIGLEAIRESMNDILSNGGLNIRISNVQAHSSATICVHHLTETIIVQSEQGPQTIELAATNVFLKGPNGWELYLHQSTPLQAEDGAPSPRPAGHLH